MASLDVPAQSPQGQDRFLAQDAVIAGLILALHLHPKPKSMYLSAWHALMYTKSRGTLETQMSPRIGATV